MKKETVIRNIVIALLSVFTAVVKHISDEGDFGIKTLDGVIDLCSSALIFFIIFCLVEFSIFFFAVKVPGGGIKGIELGLDRKGILISSCFCFILNIPYIIIFYPGVCNWDTINQLTDFFTGKDPMSFSWIPGQETVSCFLNDHHPVFDTIIYSMFIGIGKSLGNINAGMFLFTVVQVALMSLCIGLMVCYLSKLGVPLIYRQFALLFVSLMPCLCVFNVTMIKDSTYSLFFIIYLIVYIDIVRKGADLKTIVLYTALSLLLCLTKKTGVYLVLISGLALLLAPSLKGKRLRMLIPTVIPVSVMFILLPKVIFPMADIYPGGKQEMMSTFIQQTARVVVDHGEELSSEEKDIIDNIVDYDGIEDNYSLTSSDNVKDTYRFEATGEERAEFMKLWISLVFRYPGSCIKATLGTCGGFFSPVSTIQIYTGIPSQDWVEASNPEGLSSVRLGVKDLYNKVCSMKYPVPFYTVIYSWWIPLFTLLFVLERKSLKHVLCLVPVLVSILVLFASPYNGARYALSLIYTAPLIIGIIFSKELYIKEKKQG